MRAVGYRETGAIERADSLIDLELDAPVATGHDLLVSVRAVSVNPVDTKIRRNVVPETKQPRVLGWDAAGVVVAVGEAATGFKPGDAVFYAGALNRPGTNAELHLVDARIAALKPASLGFADAAALPLTALTAWEALFDRLDVRRPVPGGDGSILVIGGAGGVSSMAIQIARAATDLQVIATASRPETADWCRWLGAHAVIDHSGDLADAFGKLGRLAPGFVFSTTGTDQHLPAIARLIAPQGRFAVIDDPDALDIMPFKRKSVSTHWEFMFTRSMFDTADLSEQGRILAEIARLVDAGALRSTRSETMGPIDAATLKRAHALIESGRARGKIVLEGFGT